MERWNPEFFERLHGFLRGAEERDIIVEVVLFSNTYSDSVWGLNPLNPANNITLGEPIPWFAYLTCRQPELLMWQRAHLRRIVEETNCYENVFYEICNEPGAFTNAEKDLPAAAEVNGWQNEMIALIREVESGVPRQHLIAGQEAMLRAPFEQPCDATFEALDFDIVNVHPLPNTTYRGQSYNMGPSCQRSSACERCGTSPSPLTRRPNPSTTTRTMSPAATWTPTGGPSIEKGPGSPYSAAPTTI